jgi:hypothetical protein
MDAHWGPQRERELRHLAMCVLGSDRAANTFDSFAGVIITSA